MDRRTFLEAIGLSGVVIADGWKPFVPGVSTPSLMEDGTGATQDIALFGVASNGTVEQWDGHQTTGGILLRWFEPENAGFPHYGYDVYRARISAPVSIPLGDRAVGELAGKKTLTAGGLEVTAAAGLAFHHLAPDVNAILVDATSGLGIRFSPAAWYIRIVALPNTSLVARAFASDKLRIEHTFATDGLTAEWITRGVERIEFSGPGEIKSFEYALMSPVAEWTHLKHVCLPVRHPAYPCKPDWTGPDEDEAKRRMPPEAQPDWSGTYKAMFAEMYPTLTAIARGQQPPPLPASTDPDAPAISLDPLDPLRLASLNPHVARMVGLAWDDHLDQEGGLKNQAYAYKVIGRWKRPPSAVAITSFDQATLLDHHLKIEVAGGSADLAVQRAVITIGATGHASVTFPVTLESVSVRLSNAAPVRWRAVSADGDLLASGQLPRSTVPGSVHTKTISVPGMRQLVVLGPAKFQITRLEWHTLPYVDRVGLLPGILARELGPPHGPSWVSAVVRQPAGTGGPVEAALDWELDDPAAPIYRNTPTPLHQAAGFQVSNNPTAARPAYPTFDRRYLLLDGDYLLVPPAIAAAWPPRQLLFDRNADGLGLKEGWRCWWARAVDLFGRVSKPSAPFMASVEDTALPPPPLLLLGEYAQTGLAAVQSAPAAQSSEAREWLAANPNTSAFTIAWTWTPELELTCKDVDGFRIYARRPAAVSSTAAYDPTGSFEGVPWGSPLADLGPVPVHFGGKVTAVVDGIPGPINLTSATLLEGTRWVCVTDLTLQLGAGALVGARLRRGTAVYAIVGHGEGKNVALFVEDTANAGPPAVGSYSIDRGSSDVITVTTNITPPSDPALFRRRISGALVRGDEEKGFDHFIVLNAAGAVFACRAGSVVTPPAVAPSPPAVGDAVLWYPAYVFVIPDTGQGPQGSPAIPVAYGQLTVASVRRWASRPLESPPAVPATITAVDATVPPAPVIPIPAAGDFCAELATRADWYGKSRYTLSWTPDPNLRYVVYRALGESIMRLDLDDYVKKPTPRSHSFPEQQWIPEIWNDGSRKQLVLKDLLDLDNALGPAIALTDNRARRLAITAAYETLHSDTQRIIAFQSYARAAYVALNGTPLEANQIPFTDEFDGRARARWFYRIAAKTLAGMEGEWTQPTPPICAPDSVPPTTPQVQAALADIEKVTLRWIASPEKDVAKYIIYRAADEASAADIRTMTPLAFIAPAPTTTPTASLQSPAVVSGKSGWLEFAADAAPAGEYFFRLVGEDMHSNRSGSSGVLRARSLSPAPAPPVWTRTQRSTTSNTTIVSLRWSHPTDQRLSCLVERRIQGQPFWKTISDWLPRGTYEFEDAPKDPTAAAEYRLRVRDRQGATAVQLPVAALPHA